MSFMEASFMVLLPHSHTQALTYTRARIVVDDVNQRISFFSPKRLWANLTLNAYIVFSYTHNNTNIFCNVYLWASLCFLLKLECGSECKDFFSSAHAIQSNKRSFYHKHTIIYLPEAVLSSIFVYMLSDKLWRNIVPYRSPLK